MNRWKLSVVVAVICVAALSLSGRGQQAPPPPPPPPPGDAREPMNGDGAPGPYSVMLPPPLTRLEAFAAQTGALIVKGYTDIGTLNGDDATSVLVSAVHFSDGTNKASGVAVHVAQQVEGRTVQTTAYVDDNELDALIAAIENMSKLQDGASPLQKFDARYQTRGALELVSTNLNGGRVILVRAMELQPIAVQPVSATSQFFVSRLPELAQRLTAARDLLARINAPPPDAQPQPQP